MPLRPDDSRKLLVNDPFVPFDRQALQTPIFATKTLGICPDLFPRRLWLEVPDPKRPPYEADGARV